ncbi:MAG: hypothetical protein N3A69_04105 [Leptospiraceae bacterium]|nr:hypothetical protein [Leptospiraceae bacterium]
MIKKILFILFCKSLVAFFSASQIFSQELSYKERKEIFYRDYTFLFGFNYDVLNVSENSRTLLKMYSDAYYRGFEKKLENSNIKEVVGFTWTFVGKWLTFLLPHELGHGLRTEQVGGGFRAVKFAAPGIVGDLRLPKTASSEDHTLALIGGFEANYLTTRDVQMDFYRYNGLYNDEYGMAFAHRIMYPLYAFLFSPQNPNDPQTWIRAGGDPVNFTKLVWERGSRKVFIKENEFLWEFLNQHGIYQKEKVNPKLIQFYNQTAIASIFWNLIDWNLYRQADSFFGEQMEGKRPKFFEISEFKWSYATLFNTSTLRAELYWYHYFQVKKNFFSLYFKTGFPYKNQGLGFFVSEILTYKAFSIDLQMDFWKQEFYGNGFALAPVFRYRISKELSLIAQLGYKTKGYLLGKTVEKDGIGFIGMKYHF